MKKLTCIILLCSICITNVFAQQTQTQLWGMASEGGLDNNGTIFTYSHSQESLTSDYSFKNKTAGGKPDFTHMVADTSGKLFGMTTVGGFQDNGVIFEFNPVTSNYKVVYEFGRGQGSQPHGSLCLFNGKFYGMTLLGGEQNHGVLFEFDPKTGIYIVKRSFKTDNLGRDPYGSLIVYGDKLYGMTTDGGTNNNGVLFKYDPITNTYTKLYNFASATGSFPQGALIELNGKFYGTTQLGGANFNGVIFEFNPSTSTYSLKKSFDRYISGGQPYGNLTFFKGKLYGSTYEGGNSSEEGTVFEYDPATEGFKSFFLTNTIGSKPQGHLTVVDDKLYGLTSSGGTNNLGTIFEWNVADSTLLAKINLSTNTGTNPYGSMTLQGTKLYGLTYIGGTANIGTLFEYNAATNEFIKKIDFGVKEASGPRGTVKEYMGQFYGMTRFGGKTNTGTLFRYDPSSKIFTTIVDFTGDNGSNPRGSLTLYNNTFYGIVSEGGLNNSGLIFEYNPNTNVYTKKIDFDPAIVKLCFGNLVLVNGKFYGISQQGGTSNFGALFEYNPVTNSYTKKADFTGNNGKYPAGNCIVLNNKLYGMTAAGGVDDKGVIFEYDFNSEVLAAKYSFVIGTNGNGCQPSGSLVAYNGKLYGLTEFGSIANQGVLFEFDPATAVYTQKVAMATQSTGNPRGTLTVVGDKLFGLSYAGGDEGVGSFFEYIPAIDSFTRKASFSTESTGSRPFFGELSVVEKLCQNVPVFTLNGDTLACPGSSVTLSVTSSEPYKYKWSLDTFTTSSIKVNQSGVYSVTAINAEGCTTKKTINVKIEDKTPPTAQCQKDATTCTGSFKPNELLPQSIVDNCSGAYSISYELMGATVKQGAGDASTEKFNSGITSLKYTIIDNSGNKTFCSSTINTSTETPLFAITGDTLGCPGKKIVLTALSNESYTYEWSTGATTKSIEVDQTGTYSLVAKNATGCSATKSISVKIEDTKSPVVQCQKDAATCNGTFAALGIYPISITDDCSSAMNVTYELSGATTKQGNGDASVEIFNPGLTNLKYTIMDISGNKSFCTSTISYVPIDKTVTVTGTELKANEANATAYQWVDCDASNAPVVGATTQTFKPEKTGNYAVKITKNNCTETSECKQVTLVGIRLTEAVSKIQILPNPVSNHQTVLTYELTKPSEVRIVLYTILGQKVADVQPLVQLTPGLYTHQLNLVNLGMYIVQLQIDGQVMEQKVTCLE